MEKIDSSYIISAPLNLRNIVITLYVYIDRFILYFTGSYKLLNFIRKLFFKSLLFFLHLLSSFYPDQDQKHAFIFEQNVPYAPPSTSPPRNVTGAASSSGGDIGIARALSQILSIINNIPVTSGKYEVIRALFEKLIDENRNVDSKALREVNRVVLSTAFARTLGMYEAALKEESSAGNGGLDRLYGNCMQVVNFAWSRVGQVRKEGTLTGSSAEKLATELLWLGQKLAAFGFAEEAVMRWASASKLAKLSVFIEPRLQVSLLKVSAFIFKQSSELGKEELDLSKKEQQRQMKMDMLMSWLPFLCRASNGIEAPILSITERVELEKILGESIDELGSEGEQEKVLSLWLHHFMYAPCSDWPNLQKSYKRWFSASRKIWI